MTGRLPPRTFMVTFLHNAIRDRRITVEHLADLLDPTPERTIRAWLDGTAAPSAGDLMPLATALRISPVELTAGWLVDQRPELERMIRADLLDPLDSRFPRSSDYDLIALRERPDMTVMDPHDEREPTRAKPASDGAVVRKRSAAARKPQGTP
jgi:hypothetical protein